MGSTFDFDEVALPKADSGASNMLTVSGRLIIGIIAVAVILLLAVIIAAIASKKKKTQNEEGSYFDGTAIQLIGKQILAGLLIVFTLGFGTPWAICMLYRWEISHTVINGRRLKFTGKGGQLFGKYILWNILTVITIGIFSFWYGVKLQKWITKHTVYADDTTGTESCFTGGAGGWFCCCLLMAISACTLGIALPWAEKHFIKWRITHTVICGDKLTFTGKGGQLFVKYLVRVLLTPVTLGIYNFFFPIIYNEWMYSHTEKVK